MQNYSKTAVDGQVNEINQSLSMSGLDIKARLRPQNNDTYYISLPLGKDDNGQIQDVTLVLIAVDDDRIKTPVISDAGFMYQNAHRIDSHLDFDAFVEKMDAKNVDNSNNAQALSNIKVRTHAFPMYANKDETLMVPIPIVDDLAYVLPALMRCYTQVLTEIATQLQLQNTKSNSSNDKVGGNK